MDRRNQNIRIFNDTERMCSYHDRLWKQVQESREKQKLVLSCEMIPEQKESVKRAGKVIVSGKRSFEAASAYKGKKTCVLNFASSTNAGGGVVRGANAQEECLCRCSTLYPCLNTEEMWEGFYYPHRRNLNSLYNDDCIYTPDVLVFKTDTKAPELMAEESWYPVNIITCAAPNLRSIASCYMNPDAGESAGNVSDEQLYELHLQRGWRIFELAKSEGNEVLILGAFGCGAFQNPPEVVARAYKTLLEEFREDFDVIEFAVYTSGYDKRNYEVFRNVLG